jgi:hypothetical protein
VAARVGMRYAADNPMRIPSAARSEVGPRENCYKYPSKMRTFGRSPIDGAKWAKTLLSIVLYQFCVSRLLTLRNALECCLNEGAISTLNG